MRAWYVRPLTHFAVGLLFLFGIARGVLAADPLVDTAWVTAPMLVFQGADDDTVPPSTSDQVASAEPELVTLVVTEGADHVESWNVDPSAYGRQLTEFLEGALG